jgi:hypothetical protein
MVQHPPLLLQLLHCHIRDFQSHGYFPRTYADVPCQSWARNHGGLYTLPRLTRALAAGILRVSAFRVPTPGVFAVARRAGYDIHVVSILVGFEGFLLLFRSFLVVHWSVNTHLVHLPRTSGVILSAFP